VRERGRERGSESEAESERKREKEREREGEREGEKERSREREKERHVRGAGTRRVTPHRKGFKQPRGATVSTMVVGTGSALKNAVAQP